MKFVLLCGLLLSSPALALLDTNNNGVSDLWEKAYNNGELFSTYDPAADPDGDGWTNESEALAGTDPFNSTPPAGFLRPEITHIPAVYITGTNGDPEILTPTAITLTWPALAGKKYTLLSSTDLTENSWVPVDEATPTVPADITIGIQLTQPDGTTPPALFIRIAVSDLDTDGDGLTNSEENQLGTSTTSTDTDGDGLPDDWEIANNIDPNDDGTGDPDNGPNGDPDRDRVTNINEYLGGTNGRNPDEFPIQVIRNSAGAWGWSTKLPQGESHPYNNYTEVSDWTDNPFPIVNINTDFAVDPAYLVTLLDGYAFPASPTVGDFTSINAALAEISEKSDCWESADGRSYESYVDRTRIWIKAPASSTARKLSYLRLKWKSIWNASSNTTQKLNISSEVVDFTIPANQTLSNPVDLTPMAAASPGCLVTYSESLERILIEDNTPATGVDATSNTADPADTGYQENFWIMAPAGNDTNGNPCKNAMKFKIPFSLPTSMEITSPNATCDPSTVPFNYNEPGAEWSSTASTSSDNNPIFKTGTTPEQNTLSLPIRVKAMKNRNVKVAVYRVHQLGARQFPTWDDEALPAGQKRDAKREKEIRHQLEKIFSTQINAWFQLDFFDTDLSYDTAAQGTPDGILAVDSAEETALSENALFAGTKVSHDINVLLVDDIQFLSKDETGKDVSINGHAILGSNTCIVAAGLRVLKKTTQELQTDTLSPLQVAHTTAHEIGHIMVGAGHPDQYQAAKPENGGFAPLQSLNAQQDYEKRLMCSGTKTNPSSNLLVKTEWDKAEVWLKNRTRGDN